MRWIWLTWLSLSLGLCGYYGYQVYASDDKSHFLIGETSVGHFQIELECSACHSEVFGGMESVNESCIGCHAEELEDAHDSHPKSKFTDPRNADRVDILDARYCITCHTEHQPERTGEMGLSLPEDYCWHCHQEVGEERESHKDLAFDTCASAGCHNYHDNRALYEAFLVEHAGEPVLKALAQKEARNWHAWHEAVNPDTESLESGRYPEQLETRFDSAAIAGIHQDWLGSAHAEAGVDCMGCHQGENESVWTDSPGMESCAGCHTLQTDSFKAGKHGMRLAQGLSAMSPAMSSKIFTEESQSLELSCNSCHQPHQYDTRYAEVEACLGCHADDHSLQFSQSPHGQLWEQAGAGLIPEKQAVSCATCHLPRETKRIKGHEKVWVNHNQNHNLRPNEKMIRSVCMNCHGLGFAIDALADDDLIQRNFTGRPAQSIPSIEMAIKREQEAR